MISCDDRNALSRTDDVLLDSIIEWYNIDHKSINRFLSIVKRKHGLSLRIIDWLVTNYSKIHSLTIDTSDFPRDLNRDYQKHLNAFSKKNLDPFARRNKIKIRVKHENGSIEFRTTTVGQLNFFRWFISNNIEDILRSERSKIELHMKSIEKDKNIKSKVPSKPVSMSPQTYVGNFNMNFDF